MRRVQTEPRPNVCRLVQSQGLVFNQDPPPPELHEPYWPDDRYYAFTGEEVGLLERACKDVFDMLCEAADHLVEHPEIITDKLAIPAFCLRQIAASWNREPAFGSVYSRFDVCFGGLNHPDPRLRVPKFYEFNADTPTTLLESAEIQWHWLEQTGYGPSQFNSLSESLIEGWKRNLKAAEAQIGHRPRVVHFAGASEPSGEEGMNTLFLANMCREAGYSIKTMWMHDIALGPDGRFYDSDREHIDVIFKLYPWEDMVREKFGPACFADMDTAGGTVWIEAPYKMLWSNKAIFAILWDLFKDDPRAQWLLPTYLEPDTPATMTRYARKPIYSREGAGVTLRDGDRVISDISAAGYGEEGYVCQDLALLPHFTDDRTGKVFYPLLGLWMVDGEPAGLGVREDLDPVTGNTSTFVPHVIEDAPEIVYQRRPMPTIDEIEAVLSIDTYLNPVLVDDKAEGVLTYIDGVVAPVC